MKAEPTDRFDGLAFVVWAVTMLGFLVWLVWYAAVEFRPAI